MAEQGAYQLKAVARNTFLDVDVVSLSSGNSRRRSASASDASRSSLDEDESDWNADVEPLSLMRARWFAERRDLQSASSSVSDVAPASPSAAVLKSESPEELVEKMVLETQVPRMKLMALHEQGLLALIPRNRQSEVTSVGSIKHLEGDCSPCLFYFRGKCTKAILCTFCHIRHKHERIKRIRPSKKTRDRISREGDRGAAPSDQSALNGEGDDGENDEDASHAQDVGAASARRKREDQLERSRGSDGRITSL